LEEYQFGTSGALRAIGPIIGYSRSCLSTSLYLEEHKLLLDVGPLSCYIKGSVEATKVLITHLHHDHWSGLISLLGLKKCRDKFDPVHIYSPRGTISFLKSILSELRYKRALSIILTPESESTDNVENRIPVVLHSLEANQSVETGDGLMIETFNVTHRCESLGFKLDLKRGKEEEWTRLLTYTGDTNIEALLAEDVLSSPVLITECTYLEPEKTRKAEERGHMSLSNVVDVEPDFRGDCILLVHFKANYTDEEINKNISSYAFSRVTPKAICTKISDAEQNATT
jgi:ribonuclease BN (tRNA processing enzyme)